MRRVLFRINPVLLIILILGCSRGEPEGVVKKIIEPYLVFNHPVMYWETKEGTTALYRILENTNDINCIAYDLEGIRDLKTTSTATYMLRDNQDGNLALTRLEMDRTMLTDIEFETKLAGIGDSLWAASRNNIIAIAGKNQESANVILRVEFSRKEPEETYDPNVVSEPEITFVESIWYSTSDSIADITISKDGTNLAVSKIEDATTGAKGLYLIDRDGNISERITENPVTGLGGFSPDGSLYLATFAYNYRADVFLINAETLDTEPITSVAIYTYTGNPAWHPNGRYLMYTIDFPYEFVEQDTPLQGEQLYMYNLGSNASRRLGVFDGMKLWVDFSPEGDLFLYSSTPGVMSRTGRAVAVTDIESGLETWRLMYIPWKPDDFTTANPNMLTPDQTQHVASYTMGGDTKIGFVWGPGGELPPENR